MSIVLYRIVLNSMYIFLLHRSVQFVSPETEPAAVESSSADC